MDRIRRISPNNPVRKELFPKDLNEQATTDNLANTLQEDMEREQAEKMKKYNFDFKREVALEGKYLWYKYNDAVNDWVEMEVASELQTGMLSDDDDVGEKVPLSIQAQNETTPRTKREEMPLLVKRRSQETNRVHHDSVKKKLLQ